MEQKCHFFRMHALYGARANIEPPVVGDSGLPADSIFDSTSLFPDSQLVSNVAATTIHLDLSEDPQPDVEAPNVPQASSRGGVSQHSGEDLRSSGRDRPSRPGRDRPPTCDRKNSLISTYEEEVKEKLVLQKAAQEHKVTFRDAILDDRRQAREAKQRSRMAKALEVERRLGQTAIAF
ncbi:hypothetical protein R1sor_005473 [Riccia sorocarpa]|uniref:Remorin C-terminal domain-containing protein n=1 Tax=Riccia sorocarpa TaxID=122646 RepID=A0ABD3HMN8_9MARC